MGKLEEAYTAIYLHVQPFLCRSSATQRDSATDLQQLFHVYHFCQETLAGSSWICIKEIRSLFLCLIEYYNNIIRYISLFSELTSLYTALSLMQQL